MSLLRVSAARSARTLRQQRGLVSTVLLTKQWNDRPIADLRKEAKARGLPTSGAKATLITRIQDHENRITLDAISSPPSPPSRQQVRHAHVLNPPTANAGSAAPASAASAPGVPPANMPKYDKQYLDVKIPDLSIPDAEPILQIPFGPDYWHSKSSASAEPKTVAPPKLLVVAGEGVHPGTSSVAQSMETTEGAATQPKPTAPTVEGEGGIFTDILEDLGLGSLFKSGEASKQAEKLADDATEKAEDAAEKVGDALQNARQALSDEDRRGAWVLGGILAGAFFLGGVFDVGSTANRKAAEAKAKAHSAAAQMKTKAKDVKNAAVDKVDEVKNAAVEKAREVKAKVVGK